jgi:hypothetical protein
MRILKITLLLLLLTSCVEPEPQRFGYYDFIVKEKVILENGYYIRSTKDTVLPCSAEQYIGWDVGDTIPMKIVQNGFFEGRHLLNIK